MKKQKTVVKDWDKVLGTKEVKKGGKPFTDSLYDQVKNHSVC